MGNWFNSQKPTPPPLLKEVHHVDAGTEEKAKEKAEAEFEKKRREQVREASVKQLKNELLDYEVGQKKSLEKKYDISDLHHLNIVLIGPTGAGKSSTIGLVQQLFNDKVTIETQDAGKEGSLFLAAYFNELGFRIFDTTGMCYFADEYIEKIKTIITGQIPVGTLIVTAETEDYSEKPLSDRMHVVVIVVGVEDPRLEQYKKDIGELKKFLKVKGLETINVFVNNWEGVQAYNKACEELANAFGTANDRLCRVKNHIALNTVHEMKTDSQSQLEVLNMLHAAIVAGERHIVFCKQTEVNEKKRQGVSIPDGKELDDFFDKVIEKHMIPPERTVSLNDFREYLRTQCITSTEDLMDAWDTLDVTKMPSKRLQKYIQEQLS